MLISKKGFYVPLSFNTNVDYNNNVNKSHYGLAWSSWVVVVRIANDQNVKNKFEFNNSIVFA